jgi:hypothetical protein
MDAAGRAHAAACAQRREARASGDILVKERPHDEDSISR